jgi:hypothetical protein
MDMPTDALASTSPASRLRGACVTRLMNGLAATMPGSADDAAGRAESLQAIQELFDALNPQDAADAQLAAIAVAAALSAMDTFARAARPGVSDETATRLRSNGLAAGRAYASALRQLRKQQAPVPVTPPARTARPKAPPAARKPVPAEPADIPPPMPIPDVFRPRDRNGQEIPGWRRDLMTEAQARAAYSYPPDPAAVATALAEEEAMIAEQQAQEARSAADNRR